MRIGKFFYLYKVKGFWWFRFFGKWGLIGYQYRHTHAPFSIRMGYKKSLKIGNWLITTI